MAPQLKVVSGTHNSARQDKIQLDALSFAYLTKEGETPALQELDFGVSDGEFCSIVGPSGCGKSTLLSILSGLLDPTQGRALLNGVPISGTNGKVGFFLQKDHLFEWRTVLENAHLGLEIIGDRRKEASENVHHLLETYGLGAFKQAYPHQLSGGMRQRVALIRTLATNPDVLLLDEPFSALDYQTTLVLERDVHAIIREHKKTALMVTHDIEEAVSMSDRVVVLSNRPARVKKIYQIDLTVDGPLNPMTARNAPEFRDYCNAIWGDLEDEQRAD